jgi:hypothetical protein
MQLSSNYKGFLVLASNIKPWSIAKQSTAESFTGGSPLDAMCRR